MAEESDAMTDRPDGELQSDAKQIRITMQQGEHTGQPIFTNFTSVQGLQGAAMVDFGFLDPQNLQALNRLIKSGDVSSNAITAKMSCRMVLSIDATKQLSRQLNQLLLRKKEKELLAVTEQQNISDKKEEAASSNLDSPVVENKNAESGKSGFRFPWSKK